MTKTKLPPELEAYFNEIPVLTEADTKELGDAIQALNSDPQFIADEIKEHFLNTILAEMHSLGLNQNQLAAKWGKKRQYVSTILNPDKLKNFTIDTIVGLSMAVGLRLDTLRFKPMESAVVSDFFIEVDVCCQPKIHGDFCSEIETNATKSQPAFAADEMIFLNMAA